MCIQDVHTLRYIYNSIKFLLLNRAYLKAKVANFNICHKQRQHFWINENNSENWFFHILLSFGTTWSLEQTDSSSLICLTLGLYSGYTHTPHCLTFPRNPSKISSFPLTWHHVVCAERVSARLQFFNQPINDFLGVY